MTPIDFFVFGLKVIGGACGLPLTSLIDEFAVAARAAALIYWVKNLPVLILPEVEPYCCNKPFWKF